MNNNIENPLIWPLLTLIEAAEGSCQIHNLATKLKQEGLLDDLDPDPNKALFKTNFLLMNALYQLQTMLLPSQWLQVETMNIKLFEQPPENIEMALEQSSALSSYYLDWQHFETDSDDIEAMLTDFWNRYHQTINPARHSLDKTNALQIFGLDTQATQQQIRKKWRRLALELHPDRATGDKGKFRQACEAWQVLKS